MEPRPCLQACVVSNCYSSCEIGNFIVELAYLIYCAVDGVVSQQTYPALGSLWGLETIFSIDNSHFNLVRDLPDIFAYDIARFLSQQSLLKFESNFFRTLLKSYLLKMQPISYQLMDSLLEIMWKQTAILKLFIQALVPGLVHFQ
ncbi:hypothetical protein FGO68_gene10453 [Halteria grandinella]|uniref:Uncharacterized protein n=1 Tax=Halteria grandinella TaxID=5974 RepID=A0A8J8NH75_HALGN|nr:hypothetical protein FGO68_gene10453 [Halteria grandinella]